VVDPTLRTVQAKFREGSKVYFHELKNENLTKITVLYFLVGALPLLV